MTTHEAKSKASFNETLEGARILYHNAITDYNAYVACCGVLEAKYLGLVYLG
jgi:hypothetical protein